MPSLKDGPSSRSFAPVSLRGGVAPGQLRRAGVSKEMAAQAKRAPTGASVAWGIPFRINKAVVVR